MKQQDKELKETPQNGERKVFFLCNGNKAGCTKEACFKHGGGCLYTSDVMYAANFREGIGERPKPQKPGALDIIALVMAVISLIAAYTH
ncbi:MAG: hypothetical protein HFJ11_07345 [Bacilli bacterium]|nr:hypothetical protein [Bacilli bacterium]